MLVTVASVDGMFAWVGEGCCREGEEGDGLEHHVVWFGGNCS
jgi:hypothetical protein